MRAAFLVHVDVPDGTTDNEVRQDIARAISIKIDDNRAGVVANPEIDARSAQVYNPEWGGVVVYQP